jgi:hypothetical protein
VTGDFVLDVRTGEGSIATPDSGSGGERLTVRVQVPELWDVVRIDTHDATRVSVLKETALAALYPSSTTPDDFLIKLNGFEIADESVGLAAAGAKTGSTFLVSFRRRRPVR